MTDLEQPATRLRCLKIALTDFKMLRPESGAQMTGLSQEWIADGDAVGIAFIHSGQRQSCDFLEA